MDVGVGNTTWFCVPVTCWLLGYVVETQNTSFCFCYELWFLNLEIWLNLEIPVSSVKYHFFIWQSCLTLAFFFPLAFQLFWKEVRFRLLHVNHERDTFPPEVTGPGSHGY